MNWDWDKLKKQQGSQGGGQPPQLDEIVEKLKNVKFPGGTILIIIILVFVFFAFSIFYKVDPSEEVIIQRFGKYVRTETPGPHFKLPDPIEKKTRVQVRKYHTKEFGFVSKESLKNRSRFQTTEDMLDTSLMLSGDLNVAVVPWIIQYRIKNPTNYLFKVRDVEGLLVDMSEATMRLVVGDRSVNEVITKRDEIAVEAQELLQKELDNVEAGIHIKEIELKRTNVPEPVQPSFNEVNKAGQEKEQMIYKAREDYNKIIPAAKGEAERTIKAAEGYALDRVNRAKGDATRFLALYKEYAKAKDVTKRRLYLENLKKLLPKIDQKYIIDANQKNLLPLLNLGKQIEKQQGETK
jgi:membrane protease subunit HflK